MTFLWMFLPIISAKASSWERTTTLQTGDKVVLAVDNGSFSAELTGISTTSTKYGLYSQYADLPSGNFPLQVVEGSSDGSFAFQTPEGNYLCWISGNSLNVSVTLNENSSWTVSFDTNGMAKIQNVSDAVRVIRWNNNTNAYRFACYASGQFDVFLWKQTEDGEVTPPVLTPSQSFVGEMTVEIKMSDGCTVFFTTDGSEPSLNSEFYSEPFDISQTTMVKAIAVDENGQTSKVISAQYTKLEKTLIQDVQNSVSTASVFIEGLVVASCASGAVIYDGTDYILYYNVNNELWTGESVRVQGVPTTYGGAKQFTSNAIVTELDDLDIEPEDMPQQLTKDDLINEHDAGVAKRRLVSFNGQFIVSGNYYNLSVGGNMDVLASILKPNEDYSELDGQEVCVVGYEMYVTGKYVYFVATEVTTSSSLVRLEDWTVLKNLSEAYGGDSWGWTFGDYPSDDDSFGGVTVESGYVTEIDLSNKGMKGGFPFTLLTLPRLKTLDLQSNQLEGNLDGEFDTFAAQNEISETLSHLSVDNNQFSGNLGAFAAHFPNLEYLSAESNHFSEISPMVSPKVELYYGSQKIEGYFTLNLKDGVNVENMPSIFLYDHDAQSYSEDRWLALYAADDVSWTLHGCDGIYELESWGIYKGKSGDVVQAVDDGKGHSFSAVLNFQDGDVNFDGEVNVLDLQGVINYIYNEYDFFSFHAANLKDDEIINVQDAVLLVAQMLDDRTNLAGNTSSKRRVEGMSSHETTSEQAMVYVENGNLVIDSSVPLAAFDIELDGADDFSMSRELKEAGFVCATARTDSGIRVVCYSLARKTVPAGMTIVGNSQCETTLAYVLLSDVNAKKISCGEMRTVTSADVIKAAEGKTVRYRLPIDSRHTLEIYPDGKKTIVKDEYNK